MPGMASPLWARVPRALADAHGRSRAGRTSGMENGRSRGRRRLEHLPGAAATVSDGGRVVFASFGLTLIIPAHRQPVLKTSTVTDLQTHSGVFPSPPLRASKSRGTKTKTLFTNENSFTSL